MSPSKAPRLAVLIAAVLVMAQPELVQAQSPSPGWSPFEDRSYELYTPRGARRARPPDATPEPPTQPAAPPLPAMSAPPSWQGGAPAARQPAGQASPMDHDGVARPPERSARPPAIVEPADLAPTRIERGELPPVMAGDGSGLPHELWRGLDTEALGKHIAALTLPPRSAAISGLWRRLLTADLGSPAAPSSGRDADPFLAVRIEALHRSGLIADAAKVMAGAPVEGAPPLIEAMRARAAIGAGEHEQGCAHARNLAARREALPEGLRAEVLLFAGYCAAVTGNAAAVGLAADLAREEGKDGTLGLQVLEAVAAGAKPKLVLPKELTLTDYRLLEAAGLANPADIIDRGEPALVARLAVDERLEPRHRVRAAESAARLHAILPETLAAAYRAAPAAAGDPLKADPALRRALLFKSAEADRNPNNRTRGIRALIDDARRNGLALQALQISAPLVGGVQRVPEIGWFAETAVEALIAAGDTRAAREWVAFQATLDGGDGRRRRGAGLAHWLMLADIADERLTGPRGAEFAELEELAVRGRLAPDFLHRLATVLDALDYDVPIPLWEAASRTPQPTTGFLPETGVLAELQDAAKKKELGRTVLLAMRALGPTGAEGAHMIGLGDSIRALRRAGLVVEARRLALEALLAGWPRNVAP